LLEDPFEREALLPLLELRGLLLDFGFAFEAFDFADGFAFEAFDFDAGSAVFDAPGFFDLVLDLGVDLVFV
jgi:hypothetical protein